MKLLKIPVLFDSLLKRLFVLGRDVHDLGVESLNFHLVHFAYLVFFVNFYQSDCLARMPYVARRTREKLDWALAEVFHLTMEGLFFKAIKLVYFWDVFLVCMRLEEVVGHLGSVALLEVAEDQINPFRKHRANIIRFKRLSHLQDKVKWT